MAELISRTGRVQSWIDDPDGRLLCRAQYLLSMIQWKVPKGSKQAGDSPHMPCETEQDVQFTYQTSDPKDMIMAKGYLPVVLSRSGKSILL